jgi:hypothetical protein
MDMLHSFSNSAGLCPSGFMYLPTFATSYEVTGNQHHLAQALTAAEATAFAYNVNTQSLRTFEGWAPAGRGTDPGISPVPGQVVIVGE